MSTSPLLPWYVRRVAADDHGGSVRRQARTRKKGLSPESPIVVAIVLASKAPASRRHDYRSREASCHPEQAYEASLPSHSSRDRFSISYSLMSQESRAIFSPRESTRDGLGAISKGPE